MVASAIGDACAVSDKHIRSAVKADPEARPTDVGFWKQAKIVLPQAKQTVTIRLDAAAERLSDADQRRAADLLEAQKS